jgi:hypothetical protein
MPGKPRSHKPHAIRSLHKQLRYELSLLSWQLGAEDVDPTVLQDLRLNSEGAREYHAVILPVESLTKPDAMPADEFALAQQLHRDHQKQLVRHYLAALRTLEPLVEMTCRAIEQQNGEPRVLHTQLPADVFIGAVKKENHVETIP